MVGEDLNSSTNLMHCKGRLDCESQMAKEL